jgi:hypothetical protein
MSECAVAEKTYLLHLERDNDLHNDSSKEISASDFSPEGLSWKRSSDAASREHDYGFRRRKSFQARRHIWAVTCDSLMELINFSPDN